MIARLVRLSFLVLLSIGLSIGGIRDSTAQPTAEGDPAARIRHLESRIFPADTLSTEPSEAEEPVGRPAFDPRTTLADDLRRRLREANRRDLEAWKQVGSRADWEKLRDERLAALRRSLGRYPAPPEKLKSLVTGTLAGEGFVVENVVYESRPGIVVTANLYRPAPAKESMPAILVSHSHNRGQKSGVGFQGLHDMGAAWGKAGCLVLVPDHLGHVERKQHPFRTADDFAGEFNPARQDYWFRYDTGIQLHLIGDSLMGWMKYDLERGVDFLLAQRGVDPRRVLVLGEVAGGGDPAAVTAALDSRITASAPFNFGGPQPESPYPLPENAAENFEYAGGGSWETTRGLRHSARDGFLPWTIVAAPAPKPLIYGHEFAWDREHDPVWARLTTIYGFYEKSEALAAVWGSGSVRGHAPEDTHWRDLHRERMYPHLEKWFSIPDSKEEPHLEVDARKLLSLTDEAIREFQPQPMHVVARRIAADRDAAYRRRADALAGEHRRKFRQEAWARILGPVEPVGKAVLLADSGRREELDGHRVERFVLETEPEIRVPVLLLLPAKSPREDERFPFVIGVAQQGKAGFLAHRGDVIAALLAAGVAVCLPDLRGTGETRASSGDDRGRTSPDTARAATEQMLGGTLVGARLRDLRSLIAHLWTRADVRRVGVWGDSFAETNPPEANLQAPHGVPHRPVESEPLGGMLALLVPLYHDDVSVIAVNRGLCDFDSLLDGQFVHVPFDAIVPGILETGDLPDLAVAAAPRALWMSGLVDGLNRELVPGDAHARCERIVKAYAEHDRGDRLFLRQTDKPDAQFADWLQKRLHE
ncbi:MAG: hypothetical protein WD066_19895 [Planctomycetaceae bacterium]